MLAVPIVARLKGFRACRRSFTKFPAIMLVLAIDTALESCAAAVLDTEAETFLARQSLPMKRGHAEALMPLIDEVMKASGVSYAALDRIAVTVGPGSFTGLRVGISAARGLGLAAHRPVVGVTTLAAYAAPLIDGDNQTPVIAAIDARHGHVYAQAFSGDGTTLIKPAIMPLDEVFRAARFGPAHLVGDAAGMLAAQWPPQFEPPSSVDPQPAPDIAWVAWLGASVDPSEAPPRPYYLRAPDAKTKAELAQR
jgi:tRNA threonylcarbamoyladenosine biosynthesis protein TsaB